MRFKSIISILLVLLISISLITAAFADGEEPEEYFVTLPYTQYASGGTENQLRAVILFENSNSTFTRYQIAFHSCTCRDASINYMSVMYVELLNTKDTADEAKIRSISFRENKDSNVGLWGDSDPVYGHPEYTEEYMNENYVQKLVGATKAEIDAWGGYGTQLECIDADTVSGATVSTSNIVSVLQALFAYHADHYYADKQT